MPTDSTLDRRTLLRGGAAASLGLALGALTPQAARAAVTAATSSGGVFGFGVASGDPTGTEVLLWTRVTPSKDAVPGSGRGKATVVRWELASDPAFRHVVRSGRATSDATKDHTIKVVAHGLTPYTRYWYRFTALGKTSPVGRTQTAPDVPGRTHALRLAFSSCANWTGGYFTAYRGIAAREDLDAVLFLGDYIYEYGNDRAEASLPGTGDRYGPAALDGVRDHQPPYETITLADYRVRYALYRTDPDLLAAHSAHPWIVIFDDHEITDNAYATGAYNHEPDDDPDTPGTKPEGAYSTRKAAALRAWAEWLPVREPASWQPRAHRGTQYFRRFSFGDLAELSVLETRQNRSEQVDATVDGTANPELAATDRHLPEPQQLSWLTSGLTSGRTTWHLLGNQTVFTRVYASPALGSVEGTVFNTDQWDGYQADQAALLAAMASTLGKAKHTDPVVLTGDIHSSWANDLPTEYASYPVDRNSVGVEFVCPSVTSDGFKESLGDSAATAQAVTAAFQAENPWVRYLEGIGHGFVVLDVTPKRVQADYWFLRSGGDKGLVVDPRTDPDATVGYETSYVTTKGSRAISGPVAQLGARADRPRNAGR